MIRLIPILVVAIVVGVFVTRSIIARLNAKILEKQQIKELVESPSPVDTMDIQEYLLEIDKATTIEELEALSKNQKTVKNDDQPWMSSHVVQYRKYAPVHLITNMNAVTKNIIEVFTLCEQRFSIEPGYSPKVLTIPQAKGLDTCKKCRKLRDGFTHLSETRPVVKSGTKR